MSTLSFFNSPDSSENEATRQNWLNEIGIDNPQYLVDFETGFVDDQNISGVSGFFPNGLIVSDTSSAEEAIIRSGKGIINGSNPVGEFSLTHNEKPYLELDFSKNPVDYVAFQDIDAAGTGIVTFTDGSTADIQFEPTGDGDSAEFIGLFRNDMPPISLVQIDARGDGRWGVDNIEYGTINPAGKSDKVLLSTSDGKVGSLDPETAVFTPLAEGVSLIDIAALSEDKVFGIDFSTLYEIDLDNNQISAIGNLGGSFNALGFTPDGDLYAAGGSGFYQLDTVSGKASLVSKLGIDFRSAGDLVFDSTEEVFYATSQGVESDLLYQIDLDGEAVKVGDIGFEETFGLSLDENDNLFGYTSQGEQISINQNTGIGTLEQDISGLTGSIWGAANFGFDSLETEYIEVPFTGGPSAATTTKTYSGPIEIDITGVGQAAGASFSDSFYRFTDITGNEIDPVLANEFGLYINGEPAQNFFTSSQSIPSYSADNSYTLVIDAPGGPLTFGVGDGFTVDNTGAYEITIDVLGDI